MKKLAFVIALLVCVAGCTSGKLVKRNKPNGCCEDCTGFSYTPVRYGDSNLKALADTEIGQGSKWVFRLKPRDEKYGPAKFTIEPKVHSAPDECVAAVEDGLDWIDASGSATGRDSTRNDPPSICVPKDVPPGCVYGYDVKVNGVGILDPRVRVVRH